MSQPSLAQPPSTPLPNRPTGELKRIVEPSASHEPMAKRQRTGYEGEKGERYDKDFWEMKCSLLKQQGDMLEDNVRKCRHELNAKEQLLDRVNRELQDARKNMQGFNWVGSAPSSRTQKQKIPFKDSASNHVRPSLSRRGWNWTAGIDGRLLGELSHSDRYQRYIVGKLFPSDWSDHRDVNLN